ncbi:MAG: hypothetical protein A2511_07990 [Deltaproteobacteria bacterium RIFOXYD12_FULL_50_9]|nr:MAG: hypothetical protein A2511_07990 [Deltaproteobacteria bacterium RIFOXYD12_FULL_50_9]
MGHHANNPYGTDDRASKAIDRKRQRERDLMFQSLSRSADEFAMKLGQRLIDKHIIETTSESSVREIFSKLFHSLSAMEEFQVQFKIAPIRNLVPDPNFVSLYLTQYIIEDLINHPKVQDIFGDDLEIYNTVDSVMSAIRPR